MSKKKSTISTKILIFATFALLLTRVVNKYILNKNIDGNPLDINATETETVSVDFGKQIQVGSPLVFGGAHAPNLEHQDAWDLIANAGVTMIRRDFFIEEEVPKNITLTAYKNNENNIQDTANWNWSGRWGSINNTNLIYTNARKRGLKVMGILAYSPSWLTYNGTRGGVPKDFDVFKDILKKSYKLHRPNIDFIEIWNEPTYKSFLDISNSPFKTKEEAYNKIYTVGYEAITEVNQEANDDRYIPIIGIVSHKATETSILENILKTPNLSQNLEAVSFHNYGQDEPSNIYFKKILEKNKKSNLPLYLTEWNYTTEEKSPSPYHVGDQAIAYTGGKLISFLNMGLSGANYFATTFNESKNQGNFKSAFGFYRVDNKGKSYLLPQGKTWTLLSKSMALGKGDSSIYQVDNSNNINVVGFRNIDGDIGVAMSNSDNRTKTVSVDLSNLDGYDPKSKYILELYIASSKNDGKTVCSQEVSEGSIDKTILLNLPSQSVLGFKVIKPRLDVIKTIKQVLGVSTSANCVVIK